MMDAFQLLGLPRLLSLTDDTLREAFRAAGKNLHPDAAGGESQFDALNEAFAVLSSPSQRLRHWLELQSLTAELRGAIDPALMDLFTRVGTATQRAELAIRKRDDAGSALVRALGEPEIQLARHAIERANSEVAQWISRQCGSFPEFDKTTSPDLTAACQIMRNLVFLEKWRASLRSYFSRLI